MITVVAAKNQITIPAELARQLNIEPGQRIDWQVGGNGIIILKLLPSRGELARQAAGMGREWLDDGVDPIADLLDERSQADKDEGLE